MAALVQIRNLTYQHPGGAMALNDISLDIAEHESLAVLGPNGSGKTTLLLHLMGILSGQGLVRVGGLDVTPRNLDDIRRRVGLVFQNADEQLFMPTVLEDVMFGPLNLGSTFTEAELLARDVLTSVGIGKDLFNRPPFHLSAGEKRRVALAGVLVMKPQLLLLDEPTTSLDPPGQRALLHLLRSLPQPKIIATHDVFFARALSRRAIFLQNGRLLADGEIEEIVQEFGWNPYS